jgi:hypothetical protein
MIINTVFNRVWLDTSEIPGAKASREYLGNGTRDNGY